MPATAAFDDAFARWLEQLATMRSVLAEATFDNHQARPYGHDLHLENDDLSGPSSGEESYGLTAFETGCSDLDAGQVGPERPISGLPIRDWLVASCFDAAQRGSGLDAMALHEQIAAILASSSSGGILIYLPVSRSS